MLIRKTKNNIDIKSFANESCERLAKQCKIDLKRTRKNAIKNGTADMSLEEINKIIYEKQDKQ